MTDQELRDLVASIAKMQAEAARQEEKRAEERGKADEERRKADEERRKIEAELAEERRKIEAELAEERRKTEERRKQLAEELAEERRKTEEERRKTERVIRQVNKQLGELGNKFGSFAEGMALPSMEKILRDRFNMDVVTPRATSRLNGRMIEIDVMAYDNGSRNELYIVEVKSHLTREGIDQILKTIEEFPKFFGAHRDRTVYGIIAAVDIPQNLRAEVLKEGLYLARIHDGAFELLTPKNFKPHAFIVPAAQNGGQKAKRNAGRKK
ncbi:MAG: DUF3782 domain-containing protein [Blastocatellia bacterium]